jgi:cytosine deaminase
MFDTVVTAARLADGGPLVDIGIRNGVVAGLGHGLPGRSTIAAGGHLVTPGLVDTHLHLDKSRIIDRHRDLDGTLASAIRETARLKSEFTEQDVYDRAATTLGECITHGTTTIRTQVEVDEVVELRGFHAVQRLARDHAGLVDLQLCVFAQEGLTHSPRGQKLLLTALDQGADVIGGAPYADRDPEGQLDLVFEYANRYDVPIDLHLDLADGPDGMLLEAVCRRTIAAGRQGRVTVGHVTQLSFVDPERHALLCALVADAGVGVTVLPATDLFLIGRSVDVAKPRGVLDVRPLLERGVRCSIATNNVLNAFTPYGDGSLVRIAALYANVIQASGADLGRCLDLISSAAAGIVERLELASVTMGAPADLIAFPAQSRAEVVARVTPPVWGMKAGRKTFERPLPAITGRRSGR